MTLIRTLFEDIQFAHGRIPFHYMTLPIGEVHKDVLSIASKTMKIIFRIQSRRYNGHAEEDSSRISS